MPSSENFNLEHTDLRIPNTCAPLEGPKNRFPTFPTFPPCPRLCRGIGRAGHGGGFRSFRQRYAYLEALREPATARIFAIPAVPAISASDMPMASGFRAMPPWEIIEASKHDADPVWVGSAGISHNIAQERQEKDGHDDCTCGADDNSCAPA